MTGHTPRFACPTCTRVVACKRDRAARYVSWLLRRHRRIVVDDDGSTRDAGWCPGSELPPDHDPIPLTDRSTS